MPVGPSLKGGIDVPLSICMVILSGDKHMLTDRCIVHYRKNGGNTVLADFCEATRDGRDIWTVPFHRELQETCIKLFEFEPNLEDRDCYASNCNVVHNPSLYATQFMVSFVDWLADVGSDSKFRKLVLQIMGGPAIDHPRVVQAQQRAEPLSIQLRSLRGHGGRKGRGGRRCDHATLTPHQHAYSPPQQTAGAAAQLRSRCDALREEHPVCYMEVAARQGRLDLCEMMWQDGPQDRRVREQGLRGARGGGHAQVRVFFERLLAQDGSEQGPF